MAPGTQRSCQSVEGFLLPCCCAALVPDNRPSCSLPHSYDELLLECEQILSDRGFACDQGLEVLDGSANGLPRFLDPVMRTFLDNTKDHQVHQKELLIAQSKATEFAKKESPTEPLPDDWPTLLKAVCKGVPDSFLHQVL
eukprot:366409-Chlamydomonas_euryale.AAC.3